MGKEQKQETTRRRFLRRTAAAGAGVMLGHRSVTGSSPRRVMGANDRIRAGFIGIGNRGTDLLRACMAAPDVEVAALCDVYQPYLLRDRTQVDAYLLKALGRRVPQMGEQLSSQVARHQDFRRLLDDQEIDVVVIGSPDHWHAIHVVAACEAGKDVYVEKPLSLTIQEGRRMVEAAARHQRISQVGLQRRSCQTYQDLEKLVKNGEIGQVTTARAYRISNMHPQGIGRGRKMDPPAGLDWDAWLGPAAWRDYQDNIAPYKFRWWKQYSSQAANWGVHYFDTIRWMLGEEAPLSISAHGTHVAVDDDRTIPDTMEVIFEFPSGKLLIFGQYEASSGRAMLTGEIELRGTKGNLFCDEDGYRMVPSQAGQFQSGEPAKEELQVQNRAQDLTADHMRNFLDCVRSRKRCRCDLETGHRSNTFALLANMAMDTKSRLEWDPVAEKVTNHPEANQLLQYEYRRPWRLG